MLVMKHRNGEKRRGGELVLISRRLYNCMKMCTVVVVNDSLPTEVHDSRQQQGEKLEVKEEA